MHTPWDEVKNRQANFNLLTGQEYTSGQSCPYNNCNALYNQYNGITNFQPRIGFAWTPGSGKFVVRAGMHMDMAEQLLDALRDKNEQVAA